MQHITTTIARAVLVALALLTLAPGAGAQQVFRQPGSGMPFAPRGTPPTPTYSGSPLASCTDADAKLGLCWTAPPVADVLDATDLSACDPVCRTLQFFELVELSNPDTDVVGVNVADFPPTFTAAHGRTLGLVTTDGAQDIDGAKNFETAPTYDGQPGTVGWTFGPLLITGHTHSTTRTYFPLTGGTAKSQANSQAYSPLPCPKLRRLNVDSLDSNGALRTMPSSNAMTIGVVVNSSDSATAQTVTASTTRANGTPTWTTGWAENDLVAIWIQGTGADTTANTAYRIWGSCY